MQLSPTPLQPKSISHHWLSRHLWITTLSTDVATRLGCGEIFIDDFVTDLLTDEWKCFEIWSASGKVIVKSTVYEPSGQVVCPRCKKKLKASHTCYRALGPELIPVYRRLARRWLWVIHPAVGCHYFLPGLWLPSQPQSITAAWPVPSDTAWWQRHIGVNNLPKVVTQLLPRVGFEPTTCW